MRGSRFTTNVRNAAAERDLYTVVTEAGERSVEAEERLGAYEAEAYHAMDRFEQPQHSVVNADIIPVARFIALLLTQTPEFHSRVADAAEEMFPGEAEPYRSREFLVSAMFELMERFTPQLQNRQWHIVQSDEPVFVTSDHPLVHWAEPRPEISLNSLGILSAEETYFPLSPRTVLLLLPPGQTELPDRLPAPLDAATTVNGRINQTAYQFVFHHPDLTNPRAIGIDGVSTNENGTPIYRRLRQAQRQQQAQDATL